MFVHVKASIWPEWAQDLYPNDWETRVIVGKIILVTTTMRRSKRNVRYRVQFPLEDYLCDVRHFQVEETSSVAPQEYLLANELHASIDEQDAYEQSDDNEEVLEKIFGC